MERRLWAALAISITLTIGEFAGGILSRSLALLSDSGHVLADVFAIGLSILTIRLGRKPHTSRRTFGWHRAEIFAALLNGSTLIIIALVIVYEAYGRILQPPQVQGTLVLAIALVGLVGNLGMARLLAGSRKASLNVRGAFLHVVGDTLSSVAVIVGGVILVFTGYWFVDPVIAVLIGILILSNAFNLVRESTDILLEATPSHLELETVANAIRGVPGIVNVHDLHIWTITSGLYALSGHVIVRSETLDEGSRIIAEASKKLRESFGIAHVTLQLEREALEGLQGTKDSST